MDASLPQVCIPAIVLDELLVRTWSLKATDPRDKVFALLSIAIRDRNIIRDPDYSLSVREVYLNAARHFFEAGGKESLEMLCYARARKAIAELPVLGSGLEQRIWLL